MPSTIVYGKYVVVDADTVIPSGALYLEGDRIIAAGSYAEIRARYRPDRTLGSAEALVIPGLVNAHGHGKGLTDFQRGQLDDTLETWKWRSFPPVDPYLDTRWACVQLLESGVTTTMHNHTLARPEAWEQELEEILGAYGSSGVRVAFAPCLSTENVFTYGEDEPFLASLPAPTRRVAEAIRSGTRLFGEKQYFDAVALLHRRHHGERVRVMHGPLSPQWVREEALLEIRRDAAARSLRIHTHVQQTQLQRMYGFRRYGSSLIARLEKIGFLGPEVTCGHCVWVDDEDIDILARTGASATHHPACNLRVRNGVSPVAAMLERGVTVAIGMDEKELGDDKDYLAELRLAARLHTLPSHRLDSPRPDSRALFRMGTQNGAEVLDFGGVAGTLRPGRQADLVILDLEQIAAPYSYPGHDPLDLLLYRAGARHVRTVMVAGEVLLAEGKLTTIDREETVRRLKEAVPKDYGSRFREANAPLAALRTAIAAHYAPWYAEIDRWEKKPYYWMNGPGSAQAQTPCEGGAEPEPS
jgi:5-methylthioadenosine/S-adenosylhomocysteine deaminase